MLVPLLLSGIGIHHSGLLPVLREIIEILFQVPCLCCGKCYGVVAISGMNEGGFWNRRSSPRAEFSPPSERKLESEIFSTKSYALFCAHVVHNI
eukprot:2353689-Rhodomonas_salina.1